MSKHIKHIIHYLSDEMSLAERAQFEALISEDLEVYQEYDTIKQIWNHLAEKLKVVNQDEIEDLDDLVADITAEIDIGMYSDSKASAGEKDFHSLLKQRQEAEYNSTGAGKPKSPRLIRMSVILAAAALLLLIIIPGKDVYNIIQSYSVPGEDSFLSEIPVVSRSDAGQGVYYFNRAQYAEAVEVFNSNLPVPEDPESILYGIALYETGNISKSIELLSRSAQNAIPPWKEIASWYLSLYLIQSDDTEAALAYLLMLKEAEGPYYKKASRLLRKIKAD